MKRSDQATASSIVQSSKLFTFCSTVFSMIKSGREKQAREQYPMEYYLLKKYRPVDLKELAQILSIKLKLH